MMGRTGSIVWLCFAALALLYIMALIIYTVFKNMSQRSDAPAPDPLPSRAPTPSRLDDTERTENIRFEKAEPPSSFETEHALAGFMSQIGGRKYQEDTVLVDATSSGDLVAIVCDGMGGLKGGASASTTAARELLAGVKDIPPSLTVEEALKQAAADADMEITQAGESSGEGSGGTTAVMILYSEGVIHWMSVGDSRIYILRDKQLHQITRDHNYELELRYAVEAGKISPEEARQAKRPDALISYLGMGGVAIIDTGKLELSSGDSVLLCSDGLFKALDELEIAQIMDSFGDNMSLCAEALVSTAVRKGGATQDNTSAVVIRPI